MKHATYIIGGCPICPTLIPTAVNLLRRPVSKYQCILFALIWNIVVYNRKSSVLYFVVRLITSRLLRNFETFHVVTVLVAELLLLKLLLELLLKKLKLSL
jgi:hypothetical protein